MLQSYSSTKPKTVRAATIMIALISICSAQLAASAADSVELKSLSPQEDNAPPAAQLPVEPATTTDTEAPKLHKLEINREALKEEAEQAQGLPAENGARFSKRIYSNSFTITGNPNYANGAANAIIADPLSMMNALLGGNTSKQYRKLYAERDTGYGVCGFLMNMPIGKRGYASIIKAFPSMPAAQADLRPGDLITSVDGRSTLDMPPKEVWDYFTGMPGTEVKIQVMRADQPIDVTLKRMDIGRIPDFATRAEFLTIFQRNGMSKFVQR